MPQPNPLVGAERLFARAARWALLLLLPVSVWAGLADLSPYPMPSFDNADKMLHILGCAGLAGCGVLAWQRPTAAFLAVAAFGGGVEIAQSFTTWRTAEWMDFWADVAGAGLGVAGALALLFLIRGTAGRHTR